MNAQSTYDEWKELVQLGKLINSRKKELKEQMKQLDLYTDYRPARSTDSLQRELEMVKRYEKGESLQVIANSYGITRERVRQLIKRQGVTGRSLGRYPAKEVI